MSQHGLVEKEIFRFAELSDVGDTEGHKTVLRVHESRRSSSPGRWHSGVVRLCGSARFCSGETGISLAGQDLHEGA